MAPRLLHETPDMVRFILPFIAVLLVASAASAQTSATNPTTITQPLIIRLPDSTLNSTFTFGPDYCNQTITVTWTYTPQYGQLCDQVTFWATNGSCLDTPASGDVSYTDATVSAQSLLLNRTGTFNVDISKLPGFVSTTLDDGGVTTATTCGAADTFVEHRICGASKTGGLTGCTTAYGATLTVLRASELVLDYDTKPPTAPVITGATATNGTANIAFTVNSDAAQVIATTTVVTDGGTAGPLDHAAAVASTGTVKVSDLVNNTTYTVTLRFIDAAGNVGPDSDPILVTPIPTHGFWGAYRNAGGFDEGGCAAAPERGSSGNGLSWVVMPFLALAFMLIRRASR